MHRPSRQHQHLLQKIARKESLAKQSNRKTGKRTKAWSRWVAQYAPLTEQGAAQAEGASQE
ncbi:hypothetical protein [Chondromyces crocatus]|uniref:Uncharacterized protein n=1 Tax=Chondromyces crocatus TaxID=52 RepID=A0A0K1EE77_CHOCO|nr:hypothetical protein [Chondromyces crocatus]AKT39171.1 uncharacterized protein CMC5_033180 [Chondromyces crocatus]